MDYDSALHETRTDGEHSETAGDFRVSYESESYVYFLAADNGLVKIGFASNYSNRLSQLCLGSPVRLHPLAAVRGGRVEEREYHQRFKLYRRHGEWFELTDKLEAEIVRIGHEGNPLYRPYYQRGYAFPLTLTERLVA